MLSSLTLLQQEPWRPEVIATMPEVSPTPRHLACVNPYWDTKQPQPTLHIGNVRTFELLAILRTVTDACAAIQEDITTVFGAFPVLPTETDVRDIFLQFVGSSVFQVNVILRPALRQVQQSPQMQTHSKVWPKFEEAFAALREAEALMVSWARDFQIDRTDQLVPTASPHQLACHLCLLKEGFKDVPDGEKAVSAVLMQVKHLTKYFPNTGCGRPRYFRNGRPSTLYVAVYHQDDGPTVKKHLLLGANNVRWCDPDTGARVDAFHKITKALRDARLADIITPASRALTALKRRETEALKSMGIQEPEELDKALKGTFNVKSSEQKEERYQTRLRALRAMPQDRDFLGPSGEVGVAIEPPTCQEKLPCYFCQGMMGCTFIRRVPHRRFKHNIICLGWDYKFGYGHACAEAEVRLEMRRLGTAIGDSGST